MAERTISTYTFSKSYAMTGWRIGYAVAHEPFMTALRKMVLYSTNGVATMVQWAAVEALELSAEFREKRLGEYRERRDVLVKGLNEIGFECELPAGAFYAFPRSGRSAKTAVRPRPCCWIRCMWPPSRARYSEPRARGICASATQCR